MLHDFGAGARLNGAAEDAAPLETWCQHFNRPFIATPSHSVRGRIAIQHHLDVHSASDSLNHLNG